MHKLNRADLWEIYIALVKQANYYTDLKLDSIKSDDLDGELMANHRLVALRDATIKIWDELEIGN